MANDQDLLTAAQILDNNDVSSISGSSSDSSTITVNITDSLSSADSATSSASKKNIDTFGNAISGAVVRPKTFVTQSGKNTITEISFDSDSTDNDKISKMTAVELASLEAFTGITIESDSDLAKAIDSATTTFGEDLSNTVDLSDIDLDFESEAWDTFTSDAKTLSSQVGSYAPNIDGLSDMAEFTYEYAGNVTDEFGNAIDGIPIDADFSQLTAIAKQMSKICPDNAAGSFFNFSTLLGLYNSLLGLCSKLGLSSFLASLLNCSKYADVSATSVLKKMVSTVASNGDYKTMGVISNALGSGVISDPAGKVSLLLSNISSEDAEDSLESIDAIMYDFGVTATDIVGTNIGDSEITVTSIDSVNTLGADDTIGRHLVGETSYDLMTSAPIYA